ncbi:MAG: ComF family protein [Candidatus Binataceae bacterium]
MAIVAERETVSVEPRGNPVLRHLIIPLINFLYPPRCAACGAALDEGESRRLCAACVARMEPLPAGRCAICGGARDSATGAAERCGKCLARRPHYRAAFAVARYRASAEDERGSLPALIRRHKYGLDQAAGRALAEFLPPVLPVSAADYDTIVPVPLHWRRLWWRGFNQAALLGDEIARRTGLPLDAVSFARRRFTSPQTARDHDERVRNVRRAFAVTRPDRIKGRRILLVDDVMTTGATANECARVLMAAGAAQVDVFTLARAL